MTDAMGFIPRLQPIAASQPGPVPLAPQILDVEGQALSIQIHLPEGQKKPNKMLMYFSQTREPICKLGTWKPSV